MRTGLGVLLLVAVGCSVKTGRVGASKTLYLENQSRHSVPEIEVPPTAIYTEFLEEQEAVDLDRRLAESDRRLAELMKIRDKYSINMMCANGIFDMIEEAETIDDEIAEAERENDEEGVKKLKEARKSLIEFFERMEEGREVLTDLEPKLVNEIELNRALHEEKKRLGSGG